jgi:hypothetical protein
VTITSAWCLIGKEEQILRVFEKKLPGEMFAEREGVRRELRNLLNEEIHNL